MRKSLGILLCLLLLCCAGLAACNAANAPVVALDEEGVASWVAIEGARYVVEIDGEESETQETSVALSDGQTLRVKGVLADGKETGWSKSVTYTAAENHVHSWERQPSDTTLASAANCIAPAQYYAVCKLCGAKGELYEFGVKDPDAHDWKATSTVQATCLAGGYTVCTCTRCSETVNTEFVDPLPHDYKGVTETYVLAEGSKICADGVLAQKTCNVCHQTQTTLLQDGEHHYNKTVYDLTQYGCGCPSSVEAALCPCGHLVATLSTECDPQGALLQHTCSKCGFHYDYEPISSVDEHCHQTTGARYLYYAQDKEKGLCLESVQVGTKLVHDPQYSESAESGDANGLRKEVRDYRYVCANCGLVTAHGSTVSYYDGETLVRTEVSNYTLDENDQDQGQIRHRVLVTPPFGTPKDALMVTVLERDEILDLEGKLLEWRQTKTTYDDYYCARIVTTTDGKGGEEIAPVTDHEYRVVNVLAKASCTTAGQETRRCIWCGEESTLVTEATGHAYLQHPDYGYVCLRCGKLSEQSAETVYLENVTAAQEDRSYYWVRCYVANGEVATPSLTVTVQTKDERLQLQADASLIEKTGDTFRVKRQSLQALAEGKEGTFAYATLTVGDASIRLDHVYQYQFAAQANGEQRTATCLLCNEQSVSTLPVVASAPLALAQLVNGLVAFTFVPDQSNTYYFYTEGCNETCGFAFTLFDQDWKEMATGLANGDQVYTMPSLAANQTYFLVPSFTATEGRPLVTLHAELYCVHHYQYAYAYQDGVVTQEGVCELCGKVADSTQWHITAKEGLTLQAAGSMLRYAFVPQTAGDYQFLCEGALGFSTNAYLYDEEMNLLQTSEPVGSNFIVKYACQVGKTYYLAPIFYPDDTAYELSVSTYCEHDYRCTYSEDERGVVMSGVCAKCGDVWPETIRPLSMTGDGVALVTEGNETLAYTFVPASDGDYVLSIDEDNEYGIFAELYLGDLYLDYEQRFAPFVRKQVYTCQAGNTYRIVVTVLGEAQNGDPTAHLSMLPDAEEEE